MLPERTQRDSERRIKDVRPSNIVAINREAGLMWQGPEYPTLDPGRYTVRGVKHQGPEWVRAYRRWSLRLEFGLVSEPGVVSAFFNFGSDPSGSRIGRRSRYYKAWVLANGEHPRKGQVMTPDVFLDGQFIEVEVERCNRDPEGKAKAQAEQYSRVTDILSVWWP